MKKKKEIKPHVVIATELGLEAAINRYVEVSLSLLRRKAKQAKAVAELAAAHAMVNREEEDEALSLESGVALFCITHRALIVPDETKAKSRDFGNATVGFRLNPAALDKVVAKDTWERIAERLQALPWGEPFVVEKVSIDKDEFHKRRAELTEEQLAAAGVRFVQDEQFFLEPQSALLEAARKTVEAEPAKDAAVA